MSTRISILVLFTLTFYCSEWITAAPPPRPDHVVIVIYENKAYGEIIGSTSAPNFNALAAEGALFTNAPTDPNGATSGSHSLRHPSQPNYLELFSGSNQGLLQDGRPGSSQEPASSAPPFTTPNLAASLIAAGFTFATYSESLPSVGFDGDTFSTDPTKNQYQRKHNPVANWQAADAPAHNHVPFATNQPFTSFPTNPAGYAALPTVSIVVPNEQNDMHDGSIAQGDAWLRTHILDGYYQWARTHNSLLIVTFDEDNFDDPSHPAPSNTTNQVATIFAGPMIKRGDYFEENINPPDVRVPNGFITPTGTAMNHYNVLRTVEEMFGLSPIGGSANVPAITDVFQSAPTSGPVVVPNGLTIRQGDTGNLFPLFSAKPIRYQQVYDRKQFVRFASGGELIESIAFRAHAPGIPFSGFVPQLQVNLSTTSKTPDDLSSTFAHNVGADDTQVFSGSLTVSVNNSSSPTAVNSFDIVIKFGTPFLYNPARGNLLVEIRNLQGGTEIPPLDQEIDATNAGGDAVSRAYNYGDANAAAAGQSGATAENDTLGLVTEFGTMMKPAPGPSPTPAPNTLFLNNSTRLRTGTADDVMIGGFIIGGSSKKSVVVRGIGPSIKVNGKPMPGTLQDPVIELHKSDGSVLAANDNWKTTQQSEIEATGLAPTDDRESAILISLDPGNYTVVLSGKNGTSGIGLVEAYDVQRGSPAKLLNISTRGQVQTDDNVMIGGVITGGSAYARVIFRGLGPSLAVNGVAIPGRLADPTLEVYDENGAPLAFDDNWKDKQKAEIEASGLAPTDDREAAIIGSYPPGQYTAILRGKNNTSGIGLFEAYKLN
jgi:hypothetical protein